MEPDGVEEVLAAFDLSEAERTVYLTLLRQGPGTASAIAKQADLHRRHTYDVVNALAEKGLAHYVDEDDRRVYKPATPERLQELVQERREELNALAAQVEDVLPGLMAHFEAEQEEREVKVLEGKAGIKQLFEDELRQGETIHLIGSPAESEDILEYFLPSWTKRRQEKDILIKGVFEHAMRGMVGEHPPIETRFLPEGHDSAVSICIYGDRVGIIFWIDDPLVIMIHDADAADSFMGYWRLIWQSAEP